MKLTRRIDADHPGPSPSNPLSRLIRAHPSLGDFWGYIRIKSPSLLLGAALGAALGGVLVSSAQRSPSHGPSTASPRPSGSARPQSRPATTSPLHIRPTPTATHVDLGALWGRVFEGRAPAYESLAAAEAQADQRPPGASVNRTTNTVRFTGAVAAITIVADPPNGRDMAFRAAGLENPTIEVTRNARMTVRFVNADGNSAHGWLLLDSVVRIGNVVHGPRAFPGAFAEILGDPTGAGQPVETIAFRAAELGTYRYECPVPRHAAMGMQGTSWSPLELHPWPW
jgi:plastocyanin